jgi:hypothetical protein
MAEPHAIPTITRGDPRAVKQRTRTFRPNYLSFAATYQCKRGWLFGVKGSAVNTEQVRAAVGATAR